MGMVLVKDSPRTKRMVDARPAAAGPEAARSNRSARLRTRLLMRDSAPKEPIWPLGTNSAGPSLICRQHNGAQFYAWPNTKWHLVRLLEQFLTHPASHSS